MTDTKTEARAQMLRRWFLPADFDDRSPVVAIQLHGKPCPVRTGDMMGLLRAHCSGEAPEVRVELAAKGQSGVMLGRFRVGAYVQQPDGCCLWACIDFDGGGAGHAHALADPLGALTATLDAAERHGLACYPERSASLSGWHLWFFFAEPTPLADARALLLGLVPPSAPLVGGGKADPLANAGIEVFPKSWQPVALGNLLWLPWWSGAAPGGCSFADEDLNPVDIPSFTALPPSAIADALAALPSAETYRRGHQGAGAPRPGTGERASEGDSELTAWRKRVLPLLDLDGIYQPHLAGPPGVGGWIPCRDPFQPPDATPSAGVADGSGEAERGTLHTFHGERTLSVFDYLVESGRCSSMGAALRLVAELTGQPLPPRPVLVPPQESAPTATLPHVNVSGQQMSALMDASWAALALANSREAQPTLYLRAGRLATLTQEESGRWSMVDVGAEALRARLARAANWYKSAGDAGLLPVFPPRELCGPMVALPSADLPPLAGIKRAPFVRRDGTACVAPGYDRASAQFLEGGACAALPGAPTGADAAAAGRDLLAVVKDFPFAGASHRAAWLGLVLTLVGRELIQGPAPLFALDASIRGAGKSLLADVASIIASGDEAPRVALHADETESSKAILATLLQGDALALLDNARGRVESCALEAVLTGTVYKGRRLGATEMVSVPARTVWVVSGNNLQLGDDLSRRTLPIRLEPEEERPEEREGFAHPDLRAWVRQEQPRLLAAAITMLRAWVVAGRPAAPGKPWGSFESWQHVVAGCLAHAGLPDPLSAHRAASEFDAAHLAVAALLAAVKEQADFLAHRGGIEARELADLANEHPDGAALAAALGELTTTPKGKHTARSVGTLLRGFRGRTAGGLRLNSPRITRAKVQLWTVEQVGDKATSDDTDAGVF